ncbi:MAG: glycosyltransferase family 25 protein [Ginsengibacter sp.]
MNIHPIKIFVINLKSSIERRKIMERQLNKLNLPFEIFDAINGASLTENEILSLYDSDYYNSRPTYYSSGMVGCTLTHYYIYKKIVEDNIQNAFILEDDMALNSDLPKVLNRLSEVIKKDEAIMLFYQSYSPIKLSIDSEVPLTDKYKLYQVSDLDGLISTAAYFIPYEVAQSMLNKMLPISNVPDDWKKFYDRNMLNGVRVVYPFLLQNTYQKTTINPTAKGGILFQKILYFAEDYRIFPIYHLLKRRRKKNTAKTRRCFVVNEPIKHLRITG